MSYYVPTPMAAFGRAPVMKHNPLCLNPPWCGMGGYAALGAKFTWGDDPGGCGALGMKYDENTDSCYTDVREGESLWHPADSDCGAAARWDVEAGRCVGTGGSGSAISPTAAVVVGGGS